MYKNDEIEKSKCRRIYVEHATVAAESARGEQDRLPALHLRYRGCLTCSNLQELSAASFQNQLLY